MRQHVPFLLLLAALRCAAAPDLPPEQAQQREINQLRDAIQQRRRELRQEAAEKYRPPATPPPVEKPDPVELDLENLAPAAAIE
ncbi:MAG: hypothetical protein FWF96_02190, partial [Kiritimatiellaeota bacterium]|nr:hypothetical protein [Kiritimatiellota bacterium]